MTSLHQPAPPAEVPRRHLTDRQRDLVERLVAAAAGEVEEKGYGAVTVRSIARRAGVAPATAYTYFSSKDHILGELLWRGIRDLPPPLVDLNRPVADRVGDVVRELGLGTTDSPPVVAACTTALLAPGPDVEDLRLRIGVEIHRRLRSALGPGADPAVLRVLETAYFGGMLTAGLGHMAFDELPGRMAEAAALLVGEGR